MTMLDRMRRHKSWLKWSLALVVLAFIVFYIPDILGLRGSGADATSGETIASVEVELSRQANSAARIRLSFRRTGRRTAAT